MVINQYLDEKLKIESEIQKLEKEVRALQARHRGPALESIINAMQEYEITPEEVAQAFRKGSGKAKASRGASIPPKYRDPVSGRTWTGRGRTPRWMEAALAQGRSRDEFLIQA